MTQSVSYQSASEPTVYAQTLSLREYTEKVRNDSFTFSSARPNAISLFRHKPRFTCTQLSLCQWQHRLGLDTHNRHCCLVKEKKDPFSAETQCILTPPSVCKFHVSLLLIKNKKLHYSYKNANTFINQWPYFFIFP